MSDEESPTVRQVFDGMSREKKDLVYYIVGRAAFPWRDDHSPTLDLRLSQKMQKLYDKLTEDEKIVTQFLVGCVLNGGMYATR